MAPIYPFQKLCTLSSGFIVAAAGPQLFGIDVQHARICWRHLPQQTSKSTANGSVEGVEEIEEDLREHLSTDEPASKRRKLDAPAESEPRESLQDEKLASPPQRLPQSRRSSQDSISITTDPRKKGERRKPKPSPGTNQPAPNISHLLTAQDGKALVVVTAEDKAISVYDLPIPLDGSGSALKLRSKRTMPKRMCAIALTLHRGREYLIVGDKFGDVWEVPVVENPSWEPAIPEGPSQKTIGNGENGHAVGNSGYEPSATELTVHTKGNLMALEQQRKLKEKKAKERASHGIDQAQVNKDDETTSKGLGKEFEGHLLLGHVSLLTDVAVASISYTLTDGTKQMRSYVLTSDRDEHVRVSRYPQSHVIEGFCLGMKEFVSCVKILPWKSNYLVVGTGEPSLRVYNWQTGKCLSVRTLTGEKYWNSVRNTGIWPQPLESEAKSDEEALGLAIDNVMARDGNLAVSGIWPIQVQDEDQKGYVLVALEGIPLLLSFLVDDATGSLILHGTIPFARNVLDVTPCQPNEQGEWSCIVVSLDTAHLPGTTDTYAELASPSYRSKSLKVFAVTAAKKDTAFGRRRWQHVQDLSDDLWHAWNEIKDRPSMAATKLKEAANGGGPTRGGRKGAYSPMGEFLYGLENLRKKRGEAAAAEDPEEEDGTLEGAPEI